MKSVFRDTDRYKTLTQGEIITITFILNIVIFGETLRTLSANYWYNEKQSFFYSKSNAEQVYHNFDTLG